jgi:hypothetical protein
MSEAVKGMLTDLLDVLGLGFVVVVEDVMWVRSR